MEKTILHSDLNSFYASVECLYRPEIRDMPVAVGGNEEARHGIVLAKNQLAKNYGVQTGETLMAARRKCPGLVTVPANFNLYFKFSKLVRQIYAEYTDQIEPYGIDENWLDVTGSISLFGSGEEIANDLRKRIAEELGVTVSIGVSFNKIFAKLGSDMKKPDATTVITRENYKSTVWCLPASDLLYVGPATTRKLAAMNIKTIGDLANFNPKLLQGRLGIWGTMLHTFANGEDNSPVSSECGDESFVRSVGNSTTAPQDLTSIDDIKTVFYMLSESVATRLRGHGLKCTGVQIYIRDKDLFTCDRQTHLAYPTCLTTEIADTAMEIFKEKYTMTKPLRSVGVRAINLVSDNAHYQIDLFTDHDRREKLEVFERSVDVIRDRYGYGAVQRGVVLKDKKMSKMNPKDDHTVFPASYLGSKTPKG